MPILTSNMTNWACAPVSTQLVMKHKCPFHGYVDDTFMIACKNSSGLYENHFYCSRCICDALDLTRAKLTTEEVIIETPSEDNRAVPSGGMPTSASPVVDDGSRLDIPTAERPIWVYFDGFSSTDPSTGRSM